jgi:hypothetical protein
MLAIMKESAGDVVGIRATGMMITADQGRQQRRTPRRGDAERAGYEVALWNGIMGLAGLPAPVLARR